MYKKLIITIFIFLYTFSLFAQGEKNTAFGIPKAKSKAKSEFIIELKILIF